MDRKYPHYFHACPYDEIDVYRMLELFEVDDQAIGHAIKKLLKAGKRGAKDFRKDVTEAMDTLARRIEMLDEDIAAKDKEDVVMRLRSQVEEQRSLKEVFRADLEAVRRERDDLRNELRRRITSPPPGSQS